MEDLAPVYLRHAVTARELGLGDLKKASECVALYKDFLALQARHRNVALVPTPLIRCGWLAHLIRPSMYGLDRNDCRSIAETFMLGTLPTVLHSLLALET